MSSRTRMKFPSRPHLHYPQFQPRPRLHTSISKSNTTKTIGKPQTTHMPMFPNGCKHGHTCSPTSLVSLMTSGHPFVPSNWARCSICTVHPTPKLATKSFLTCFNCRDFCSDVLPTNPKLTNIWPRPFMNICHLDNHLPDHLIRRPNPICAMT